MSDSRTSLDRLGLDHRKVHPRRRATTGEDIQKDVRAESTPVDSRATIESTTREPDMSRLYPVSYRHEVLDRYALYFVCMA